MTPESAVRVVAADRGLSPHQVNVICDQLAACRRAGVDITLAGDNLRVRIPAQFDPTTANGVRAFIRKHKATIVAVERNIVDSDPRYPDDLVDAFLRTEHTTDAMLDLLVYFAAADYARDHFPSLDTDVAVTAIDRVIRHAIDLHADDASPDRLLSGDDVLWGFQLRHYVADAATSDLQAWITAAWPPVTAAITSWLVGQHVAVLAEYKYLAEPRKVAA